MKVQSAAAGTADSLNMEGKMPTKVLFLCTGNSARSQMAEAFLRKYGAGKFEAYSAGLEPRDIHPFTIQVMEEIGFDLGNHRSKSVAEYMGKIHFGYLITVCENAEKQCPTTFPGIGQRMHWPLEDPAVFDADKDLQLGKFREIRDKIEILIKDFIREKS
jgi:arsenate reductase (thioredoxin)